jgi:hypothetical protein
MQVADERRFEVGLDHYCDEAMGIYNRWHPEPRNNFILKFPWPKVGQVPIIQDDIFRPSPEFKFGLFGLPDRN